MTADFSSVWSSRGRSERRDETSREEAGRTWGNGHEDVQRPNRLDVNKITRHSIDTLHPGLQALLTADEAFLGRTFARAETWREKREGRRTQPGSRERTAPPRPVERIQPTFFF